MGLCAQAGATNCKTPPEQYDLVDLGTIVDGQAESRAVSIDERGRIILRTIPPEIGAEASEYLIERNGKARPIKNPDELAIRETLRLIGDRMRLTDYTLIQDGFLPARAMTLIDRSGGEIDVADLCRLKSRPDLSLEAFVISDNGDHSAALFESDSGFLVANCAFSEDASILFETNDKIELAGINNDGEIGGSLKSKSDLFLWRWSDGERATSELPRDLLNADVAGIDEAGRVFAMATGTVVNPAIYLNENSELSPALVLPGEGWDVNWLTVGPCGTLFGEATYTNFATFVQLPVEEQARMRENFAEFWQYALERESALFVWSPGDRNGKFLGSVAKATRDWTGIRLMGVNDQGIAIGYGENTEGETRAIKLVPAKN